MSNGASAASTTSCSRRWARSSARRSCANICAAAAEAGARRRLQQSLRPAPRRRLQGPLGHVADADKAAEETVLRILHERAPERASSPRTARKATARSAHRRPTQQPPPTTRTRCCAHRRRRGKRTRWSPDRPVDPLRSDGARTRRAAPHGEGYTPHVSKAADCRWSAPASATATSSPDDRRLREVHRSLPRLAPSGQRGRFDLAYVAAAARRGSGASSPGTWPPECCWSEGGDLSSSTAEPHRQAGGEVVVAPPALHHRWRAWRTTWWTRSPGSNPKAAAQLREHCPLADSDSTFAPA